MTERQNNWNDRYADIEDSVFNIKPALVLSQNKHLLPQSGLALDLACGLGGNALWLAKQGLQVSAWDLSDIAIDRLQQLAHQQKLSLQTEVRDVVCNPPQHHSFDLIVVSYFLERAIVQEIINALKPGGLVFYQTFTKEKVSDNGPTNPHYLLNSNELLSLLS